MEIRNDYYVYLHRRNSDGEIFYVGKGCGRRASNGSKRSSVWKVYVGDHGFSYEIIQENMTEAKAFLLEAWMISKFSHEGLDLANRFDPAYRSRRFSQEDRIRISRRYGGKPVYCSNGMKFETMRAALSWVSENISRSANFSNIKSVCCGKDDSAYGYCWSYEPVTRLPRRKYSQPIRSSLGEEFKNISEAVKFLRSNGYPKASQSLISRCLDSDKFTGYGRKWERFIFLAGLSHDHSGFVR